MHIFKQEQLDGLAQVITAQASITCASLAQPSDLKMSSKVKEIKSIAGLEDKDLYYVQSILVTSSWNKNDDIFDKEEVWKARSTPSHKPTNLEHDEHTIIGHITANWPMTDDGMLISDDTPVENLPIKYHILTGSVIYTGFSDPVLRDRAAKLIAEIENGNKYVSMECYFRGFDYGLLDQATGKYQILSRGEETAHLTKYLRAYGGTGEHQNYKIGRVLRDITFSGKGFVDKPANPESIIFTRENTKFLNTPSVANNNHIEKNTISENIGVFSNQANLKETNMSLDQEVNTNETVKTEATQDCAEAQASIAALTDQTSVLETSLAEANTKIAELVAEKELAAKKAEEDEKTKDEENKNIKAALEAANEVIAAYKTKEEENMKKEKKMKRVAALVNSGVESTVAESTVDQFDSLDDLSFEAMTSLLAGKKAPVKDEKEETKEEASETVADASVLENVEVEENIDLSVGGVATSEIESTRAALVDFVYNRLGKKLNKGE
ncbi:hypothetical protein EBZ38_09360 [bacterium]|nr:hypothetical protein [bacterium]NDC94828.1 hypothetical protein [bacterium]NDD84460.1 hypothetical protein [bacterium]